MKTKIEQLSRGVTAYDRPVCVISKTKIAMKIEEGECWNGNFIVEGLDEQPIRGIVYTSSPRMKLAASYFESISVPVEFSYDSTGLEAGDVEKGSIFVVSDGGEYEIPFTAFIIKAETSLQKGKISQIAEFPLLAKQNYSVAFKLFQTGLFIRLLQQEQNEYEPLYRCLKRKGLTKWDMEEFLIAMEQKEAIWLTLAEEEKQFAELLEAKKAAVRITRNTWGFLPVRIECDADFVELDKTSLTTEDFIGNDYELTYVVNPEKLHSGQNYGRISIITPYEELQYEVMATSAVQQKQISLIKRKKRGLEIELLKLYTGLRLNKMNKEAWIKQSFEILEQLRSLDTEQEYYPLYQVQLYLAQNMYEEAKWILDKYAKRRWGRGQEYEMYAYYLYLNTMHRRDPSYTKRVQEEVRRLYMKDKKWEYLWLLLYLDPKLAEDPVRKTDMIRKQYESGRGSTILYLEAFLVYCKDNTKLTRLDSYVIYILSLGIRRGAFTKELALRLAELAKKEKGYSQLLFRILEECWNSYGETAILAALCSLLIKGNKRNAESFKWYALGVEKEIKITQIYEYYMYALDDRRYHKLPQSVLLYFSYQANLEERKKAQLYANVIQNAEEYPSVFSTYRRAIERFMIDQLKKRRVNRDLALIYKTFLNKQIVNEELAEALAEILFVHEIVVEDKKIKTVLVSHGDLEREITVPCIGGIACVPIYNESCRLMFQDSRNIRYIKTVTYTREKLLDEALYNQLCGEYKCEQTGYLLNKWRKAPIQEDRSELYRQLYMNKEISKEARQQIQKEVLLSWQRMEGQDWVQEFLPGFDFSVLSRKEKQQMLELMLDQGMYVRAFSMIKKYHIYELQARKMVRMIDRIIREEKYEKDDTVLWMASYSFHAGIYDAAVVEYLCDFYNRDSRSMARIWEAAGELEIDAGDLEERILAQILFTGAYVRPETDIFTSYMKKRPMWKLKKAWLIQKAHAYFVHQQVVADGVIMELEEMLHKEKEPLLICKLAILKYYADGELADDKKRMVTGLLEEMTAEKKMFACFRKYDDDIIGPLMLEEYIVIEHRTRPDKQVKLFYRITDEERERPYLGEEMLQGFEGVYTKILPLFYGEELEYYITEGEEKTAQGTVCNNQARPGTESRFARINALYKEWNNKDADEYMMMDKLTAQIFPVVQQEYKKFK